MARDELPNPGTGLKKVPVRVLTLLHSGEAEESIASNRDDEWATSHWWANADCDWNGVFQGGGAKGAAYVGALTVWAENNQWFSEVAGSSAGAITAAIIAGGYHPSEMAELTASMLSAIEPATRWDRLLSRSLLTRWACRLDTNRLEEHVNTALKVGVARNGGRSGDLVTFAELREATGINLTVVVLDTSNGHPLPFSAQWSPDVPVATAVVASCSIPVVFEPRFLEVDRYTLGATWRRLADGGVFANFPSFVFEDGAFRRYYNLGDVPEAARTIGFVLSADQDAVPPVPLRFVTNPRHIAPVWEVERRTGRHLATRRQRVQDSYDRVEALYLRGHIPRQHYLDFSATGEYLLPEGWSSIFLTVAFFLGQLVVLASGIPLLAFNVSTYQDGDILGGILGTISLLALIILSILVRRISLLIRREGISVLSTWAGLALRPPVWIGAVEGSYLVRVPAVGLSTYSFRASSVDLVEAVWVAKAVVARQVLSILDDDLPDPLAMVGRLRELAGMADGRELEDTGHVSIIPSHPFRRPRITRILDFWLG